MLELPGMTSSQEVLVNTTGAHRQVHLEEVGEMDRWTHLYASSFL